MPNFGFRHSKESKKKMRKSRKQYIQNNPNNTSFKKGSIPWNKGKKGSGVQMYGKNNPNWRGGKIKRHGYVFIYNPKHPLAISTGYVKISRLIMENHLMKSLAKEEVVHHINGIKDDDRIENLKLFANNSLHIKYHNKKGV